MLPGSIKGLCIIKKITGLHLNSQSIFQQTCFDLRFSEPEALMVRRIDGTFHKKINLSLYTSHQNLKSDSDQGYIVRVPSKDEVFVFSERGQHLETRTLFTDSILLQFTYDCHER